LNKEIATLHEIVHRVLVAHIGDVDAHLVLDAGDVEQVAAVLGNERIHQRHARTQFNQSPREIRADKAESAGDETIGIVQTSERVHCASDTL
jgi:hypothetical protein